MKKILSLVFVCGTIITCYAQVPVSDTVIVQLAKSSKLTLTVEDKSDLELLEHYDFQALFEDILARLSDENGVFDEDADDLATEIELEEDDMDEEYQDEDEEEMEDEDDPEDHEIDCGDDGYHASRHIKKIRHFINADFGINNYTDNSNIPEEEIEQSAVRPWGSWNVSINSVLRTRVSESFLIEWGPGISWYNFKFEDEETLVEKNAGMVSFVQDPRDFDFEKSKLTVSYINLSVLPMIEFGEYRNDNKCYKSHHRMFRAGLGLYGGYRLASYTKQVFDDGDRERKQINHDNFYLNNLRYGVRFQFGVFDTDFFINYDLNDLFRGGRGPELNAYSFGIVF